MGIKYITPFNSAIPSEIKLLVDNFFNEFAPLESINGNALLLFDEKSKAYYSPCHIMAKDFCDLVDYNATIDGSDEDELYKLNRDITENEVAFLTMKADAKAGRTFEDVVVEYDKTYSPEVPLKIYGGQHRIKAISFAKALKPNIYHGFRIYYGLSKEQKVEIATINNTSITVSNDLLDRMKEQLLGSELRDFFHLIDFLPAGADFSDKKDSVLPTVRVARTFTVNYWKGRSSSTKDFIIPFVCKSSGGSDEEYLKLREDINWQDEGFVEAGKQFALLHKTQRMKVTTRKIDNHNQFASKALSLTVVASWSYAAGLFDNNKNLLKNLYSLVDGLGPSDDPLNAKALSEAKLKGIDNDTYRGLGARINSEELGRMLEVFIVLVEKGKKITKDLANAAIMSFQAKKATQDANKSLAKI